MHGENIGTTFSSLFVGPLNVFRMSRMAHSKSDENVVPCVLAMHDKLEKITVLVKANLTSECSRALVYWKAR